MANTVETSVAQVGLRDFLFYVLPGSVWLTGIFALTGVRAVDVQPYMGLSSSLAAVLAAYVLGQCAYPLSYVFRRIMRKWGGVEQPDEKHRQGVKAAYRRLLLNEPTYFAVEVFRYRTMARFSAVMVLPVLFATAAVALGGWQLGGTARPWIVAVGVSIAVGFVYRYRRYENRYRASLADEAAAAQ
jgi:hypothetical protein